MKNPNSLENRNRTQNREIVVLAHNIRSTHNIGAILRTCEGFGVSKIIFSGYSPFPILPDENFKKTNRLPHIAQKLDSQIHKTALGAEKIVPAEISDNILDTIQNLKKQNFEIFALEQSKKSIFLKYAIIYININSLKLNLRRCDSSAVYRCCFSILKCYLRSI